MRKSSCVTSRMHCTTRATTWQVIKSDIRQGFSSLFDLKLFFFGIGEIVHLDLNLIDYWREIHYIVPKSPDFCVPIHSGSFWHSIGKFALKLGYLSQNSMDYHETFSVCSQTFPDCITNDMPAQKVCVHAHKQGVKFSHRPCFLKKQTHYRPKFIQNTDQKLTKKLTLDHVFDTSRLKVI